MNKETIKIKGEFIKLDQLLKFTGAAQTGGHAKELILQGLILVNGEICLLRGKKLHSGDTIQVEDELLIEVQ